MRAKLISIIGPVAVGKTTLADVLHRELPAEVLYEDYEGNPFLAESFQGFEELSLPSQLYFLITRIKQLSIATWPGEGLVVSDYGFCQDRMYAEIKLNDDDRLVYEHLCRQVEYLVTPPRVLVYLDASVETLKHRIDHRDRAFESAYTVDYLDRLRQAHFHIPTPPDCVKLSVDCERVDLLDPRQQVGLIEKIREALS